MIWSGTDYNCTPSWPRSFLEDWLFDVTHHQSAQSAARPVIKRSFWPGRESRPIRPGLFGADKGGNSGVELKRRSKIGSIFERNKKANDGNFIDDAGKVSLLILLGL